MKNILLRSIIGVTTLGLMVSSCNLDRTPSNAIPEEKSVETVQDVKFWEAGFMAGLRTVQKGVFDNIQDIQADQLNASVGFGNNMANPYTWDAFIANDADLASVWHSYYNRIKNINFALPKFDAVPASSDEDKAIIKHAKGVGHFLRAYYYFNLALRFGTVYNASTAEQDLCVPLVLVYNKTELPKRATNAEVYNQILNVDLKAAKEFLADKVGTPMASEITIDAILALESRVLLYMSEWQKALQTSEGLVNKGTYILTPASEAKFRQMWHQSLSTEEILQIQIQRPDELPNTSNYYSATTSYEREYGLRNTPDYLPTQGIIDLYDDKDIRKKVYFEQQLCIYQGVTYPLTVISKLKGDVEFASLIGGSYGVWGGYVPNSLTNPKVFRIAEQYLIAAEAASMLGKKSDALRYLNTLRSSRNLGKLSSDITDSKLTAEIRDERTRELAFEGFRLWDIRRWNLPMKRHKPQTLSDGSSPFLYSSVGLTLEIPAGHDKFVWGVPSNDIKTNPNIANQQNPGWSL